MKSTKAMLGFGVDVEAVIEAREAYRALHSESLDQPRHTDEDPGGSLIDTIGTRDAEIRRAFDRVALEALLDTLNDRERLIVQLYYQHELTQAEIGQRLGYSQMHISRLLRGAVQQLLLAASAQEPDSASSSRVRLGRGPIRGPALVSSPHERRPVEPAGSFRREIDQ